MGIDYGTKRIGVAISDPSGVIAHPLETIPVREDGSHMESLKAVVRDYEVKKIVVGLPYDMDGGVGESANRVINWARDLEISLKLPVELWDERLTTSEAYEILIRMNVKGPKRKRLIDKIAASVMLQGYLDAMRS
ncbi:MAG TPA: Holliday junction resolvase RuvX [Deltaproteobacteria bacterium]|nr:Holliday junction resolvase RuvX [Deltaproteobacteria bacterium]